MPEYFDSKEWKKLVTLPPANPALDFLKQVEKDLETARDRADVERIVMASCDELRGVTDQIVLNNPHISSGLATKIRYITEGIISKIAYKALQAITSSSSSSK